MERVQGEIVSLATDLATYRGCKHAVLLDKRSLDGELEKSFYNNSTLEALKERGKGKDSAVDKIIPAVLFLFLCVLSVYDAWDYRYIEE